MRATLLGMSKEKQYAIDLHGRIIEKHPHAPLKGGWRIATDDEIAAAADAEDARAIGEARDAKVAHEAARRASHEHGLEQKQRDAEAAERIAAKEAAVKQTVIAQPEPSE